MSDQKPTSSSVSPSLSLSVSRPSVTTLPPCRRPITVSRYSERIRASSTVWPMSFNSAGSMTSTMPISCDRSLK